MQLHIFLYLKFSFNPDGRDQYHLKKHCKRLYRPYNLRFNKRSYTVLPFSVCRLAKRAYQHYLICIIISAN